MANKSFYLTPEARAKLEAELDQLQRVTRVQIAQRIAAAKEQGDLSENFEYHAARNEQSFVLGRIRELEQILHNAEMISSESRGAAGIVAMGATVTVRDDDGEEDTYQIRGSVEANPVERIISNESPLGQALMGKKKGDTVSVQSPAGTYKLKIVSVS